MTQFVLWCFTGRCNVRRPRFHDGVRSFTLVGQRRRENSPTTLRPAWRQGAHTDDVSRIRRSKALKSNVCECREKRARWNRDNDPTDPVILPADRG